MACTKKDELPSVCCILRHDFHGLTMRPGSCVAKMVVASACSESEWMLGVRLSGPFAMRLAGLTAQMAAAAGADVVGLGRSSVCRGGSLVASVGGLRSFCAYPGAKPLAGALGRDLGLARGGGRPLFAVACCNVFCSRGGPALLGREESRVGPGALPFCSHACCAADHAAMCRAALGTLSTSAFGDAYPQEGVR